MIVKNHDLSAVSLLALLLAALTVALAAPALADDGVEAAREKQIMRVVTTDDNGELNACG